MFEHGRLVYLKIIPQKKRAKGKTYEKLDTLDETISMNGESKLN